MIRGALNYSHKYDVMCVVDGKNANNRDNEHYEIINKIIWISGKKQRTYPIVDVKKTIVSIYIGNKYFNGKIFYMQ